MSNIHCPVCGSKTAKMYSLGKEELGIEQPNDFFCPSCEVFWEALYNQKGELRVVSYKNEN